LFLSLSTGKRIHRHKWTDLPSPDDAINRVNTLARRQGMPHTLSFTDRYGFALTDDADSIDDDHDSAYNPTDNESDDDDDNLDDYDADSDGNESDDDNADEDAPNDDNADDPDEADARILPSGGAAPTVAGGTTGVNRINVTFLNDEDEESETEEEEEDAEATEDDDNEPPEIEGVDSNDSDSDDDNEPPEIEGVQTIGTTGVSDSDREAAVAAGEAEMNQKYGPRTHNRSLRGRKPRQYAPRYKPNSSMYEPNSSEVTMAQFEQPMGMLFMTEQMSLKRGLKRFGKACADAVVAEMQQLEIRKVLKPTKASDLTRDQKRAPLKYLMYLKQKRCGRIKGRGCADGRKQRLYKTKEETVPPTVSTEALFLTSLIDAEEERKVVTVDIPGAFMHADMDEVVHM
jgi:hypothetical protein